MPLAVEFYRKDSDKPENLDWHKFDLSHFWGALEADGVKPYETYEHTFTGSYHLVDKQGTLLLAINPGDRLKQWRQ